MLSIESASYETPQRVEMVARTLLGMTPPPPERVIALRGFSPSAPSDEKADEPTEPAPAVNAAGAPPAGAGATP